MSNVIAAGFENMDAGWLLQMMIFLAAAAALALCIKKLFFERTNHISPQPLIVALEKEFVTKHEHDKSHTALHQHIVNVDAYAHQESHNIREIINAMGLDSKLRSELLSALDERTKTQSRVIDGLAGKMDRIVERVADKVEEIWARKQRS